MFEIGSSLRGARTRQKLELSQIEQATRIRSEFLQALENERFDLLPGTAYAKGFLRTYADYLGLDGQRFVDEYNNRFPPAEEPPGAPLTKVRRRRTLVDTRIVIVAFALLLGLIGWRLSSLENQHRVGRAHAAPPVSRRPLNRPTAPPVGPLGTSGTIARIVLAARGPCWISVHVGSPAGKRLDVTTLQAGQSVSFAAPQLWIRLGAPWNLAASLNGRPVALPTTTASVVVTPAGVRTVAGG